MKVNFEFLDEEPIENVITCMNYKMDKVVFFGYFETVRQYKSITERFLKKHCGVEKTAFYPLSQNDLHSTVTNMRRIINGELEQGNEIYFDITGGESLLLVAFGMLAKEFSAPMHMYEVETGKLVELMGDENSISHSAEKRKVPMTLDLLIQMRGGQINWNLHKDTKDVMASEFGEDVKNIYQIAEKHWKSWNYFSDFLRGSMVPLDEELQVSKTEAEMEELLGKSKLGSREEFDEIVEELVDVGVLTEVENDGTYYGFRFKNEDIKACLWEGGSVLELHTCQEEWKHSDECMVGVHLDWDGVIHDRPGEDVLNEIDVLSLNGYIPTFISCKGGKMAPHQILHALYELETVAGRFGGKYAGKVLVTAVDIGKIYKERAAEMQIEIRQII